MELSRDKNETDWTVRLKGKEKARFNVPTVGEDTRPEVEVCDAGNGWQRVRITWRIGKPVSQDELAIRVGLSFEPDFWWAPHLSPEEGCCVAQHVFRAPAIIAVEDRHVLVVAPDLELCGVVEENPWFIDYDAQNGVFWLGMSRSKVADHVVYRKAPGMTLQPGEVKLGFFITAYESEEPVNPWGKVAEFLWERYAHPLLVKGEPSTVPLDAFVKRTYHWAFESWKDAVWQEFDIGGKRVGAPAFIVTVSQSPNYKGEFYLREPLSIWNQAWFSSLRSASGVMRYAKRTGNDELRKKANLTKELALCAPIKDGVFPSVYATEMMEVEIDGKKHMRSKGWETGHWTNSNRCPWERGISAQWYHVLDASWTALLMLRWHEDIEADGRLVEYAKAYGDKLLTLQNEKGFFPAWLHPETLEPSPVLFESPETSMSVSFLLALAEATGEQKYKKAAIKGIEAVLKEIVPTGRWEDYETYWSCCPWGKDRYLGARIPRNGIYKQNTLSMFWTAEALLEAYRATHHKPYLEWGRRTLDELSMFQQVWQPPFIYIPALGGFGVMNCDGEWNDSRQTLFAELFLEYYREMGDPNLFERGVAALKAGFVMMYCPENPRQKVLWEKAHPHFGPEDYGFTMENYGHGGAVDKEGGGIGPFTIYDWGNGAASEARNRIYDHFGDVYIDRKRDRAFGIDSISVEIDEHGWTLADLAQAPRNVKVVFEDGSSQTVWLEGSAKLSANKG